MELLKTSALVSLSVHTYVPLPGVDTYIYLYGVDTFHLGVECWHLLTLEVEDPFIIPIL